MANKSSLDYNESTLMITCFCEFITFCNLQATPIPIQCTDTVNNSGEKILLIMKINCLIASNIPCQVELFMVPPANYLD